ncbi:MAG: Cys-tRNA(Pro) deacylase [Rikenellaceae bacterium]
MAKKLNKTNAARLLDQAKIKYNLVQYEVDENNLSATHVAESLGENVEQVFKTLVLQGDKNGIFIAVIPGDKEVDLKLAAKVSANKSADMLPLKELLSTVGYIRGACSPVGMKKLFPTYFHSSCLNFETIYVSAGIRGMQIEIAPKDIITITKAAVTHLIK